MPKLNAQPRSSDSNVDFELAATMKELHEMTVSEKCYESPKEQPTFSFPFPLQNPPASANVRRVRRGTTKSSEQGKRVKLNIFKDEDPDDFPAWKVAQQDLDEKRVSSSDRATVLQGKIPMMHARSKSDSAVGSRPARAVRPRGEAMAITNTLSSRDHPVPSGRQELVEQLRTISRRRGDILRELQELDKGEDGVLAQLATAASPTKRPYTPNPKPIRAHALPAPSYKGPGSPALPVPATDAPLLQMPSQDKLPHSHKPQLPRGPFSITASPIPRKSSRIEVYPSNRDVTMPAPTKFTPMKPISLYGTPTATPTAVKSYIGARERPEERSNSAVDADTDPKTMPLNRSIRVPTKFGDDDEGGIQKKHNEAKDDDPAMALSKETNGRPKTPARTPVRTPGLSKFYQVPHTVARKRWAF